MSAVRNALLSNTVLSDKDKLRIIGTCIPESGQFLNAIPSDNLHLRMENQEFMLAIALRTGCHVTEGHRCLNCPDWIEEDGVHGLCCQKGVIGRAARHKGLNLLLSKSLNQLEIGTRLEPQNAWLGKRPDGISILPWKDGKRLAWDVIVTDSFAITYRQKALVGNGSVAEIAEKRKYDAYKGIEENYVFQPIAFESLGEFGPSTKKFMSVVGKALIRKTGDIRAAAFFRQRFSVELQKPNSWCMREALMIRSEFMEEEDYWDILDLEER
jgi:hypothetical protein